MIDRLRELLPPHTRLILAAEELLESFGTRTDDGRAITAEWGEPTAEGWYEPTFTATDDGKLVVDRDAHDRMAGALTVERVAAALHEAQVCENWSPGYRHFGDDGEVHDDHGPAEHTEAARVLAALAVPKEENPDV